MTKSNIASAIKSAHAGVEAASDIAIPLGDAQEERQRQAVGALS